MKEGKQKGRCRKVKERRKEGRKEDEGRRRIEGRKEERKEDAGLKEGRKEGRKEGDPEGFGHLSDGRARATRYGGAKKPLHRLAKDFHLYTYILYILYTYYIKMKKVYVYIFKQLKV